MNGLWQVIAVFSAIAHESVVRVAPITYLNGQSFNAAQRGMSDTTRRGGGMESALAVHRWR